ncbi:general transcription factor IIF subunit 1-like [Sycon ciliatum]|uniref:general transcription factor IIF subunit 1-like n=1 Tax=Sycon ciliatum TaxID=27933 RepID=UPI0020AB7973|eukprot:scpid40578/ scgid12655/ General transcription factor IIF subunit 1; Transcription initiation factor IIF subunit alpha; Transcription initiation factor RAP74
MDRSASVTKEYSVKLTCDQSTRSHIMRFPMPGGLDVTKLENPRLERQLPVGVVQEETAPEYGAGSEYGKKQREEARRRKRGIFRKPQSADDFPWLLRSGKKKDKSKYTGRKEGGVQQSASYYLFREVDGDTFEAVPVHSWYNFTPNVSYDTLSVEEAEEQFEKRHKTLNHFAVMMQKRMQDTADGEDTKTVSEPSAPAAGSGRNVKTLMGDGLQVREDEDWANSDSDSEGSGAEGETRARKPKAKGKGKKKKKDDGSEESEEGDEDSDDADLKQSKEVDYMSDTSSDDDDEAADADSEPKVAKKKEQDEEDSESHSEVGSDEDDSSEDDLTKSGRETKKLLSKTQGTDGSSEEEEEDEEDYDDQLAKKIGAPKGGSKGVKGGRDSPRPSSLNSTPVPSPAAAERRGKAPSKGKSKANAGGGDEPAAKKKKSAGVSANTSLAAASAVSAAAAVSAAVAAQSKGGKDEVTEEAVRRYLSRKPMTTKDLLKKFKGKTDMDGERLVMVLGEILRKINPDREKVRDKTLLSIKSK